MNKTLLLIPLSTIFLLGCGSENPLQQAMEKAEATKAVKTPAVAEERKHSSKTLPTQVLPPKKKEIKHAVKIVSQPKKSMPKKGNEKIDFDAEYEIILRLEENAQFNVAKRKAQALYKKFRKGVKGRSLKKLIKKIKSEDRAYTKIWDQLDKLTSKKEYERERAEGRFRKAGEAGRIYLRKTLRTKSGPLFAASLRLLMEKPDLKTQADLLKHWRRIKDPRTKHACLNSLTESAQNFDVSFLHTLGRFIDKDQDMKTQSLFKQVASAKSALKSNREQYQNLYNDFKAEQNLNDPTAAVLLSMLMVEGFKGDREAWSNFLKASDAYGSLRTYFDGLKNKVPQSIKLWSKNHITFFGINEEGLIAHWNLDKTHNQHYPVSFGDAPLKAKTLSNSSKTVVEGVHGMAYRSSGSNNGLLIEHHRQLNVAKNNQYTISFWIRFLSKPNASKYIVDKQGRHPKGYYCYVTHNLSQVRFGSPDGKSWNETSTSGEAFKTNTWYQISGVYDGASCRIYVNGELKGQKKLGIKLSDSGARLSIGRHNRGGYNIHADIDEVRIYNRAIAFDEVKITYQAGL